MTNAALPLIHVLLVDDDDVEVMALRRALRATATPHTLTVARDGVEALALLRGEGHEPLEKPALIFMDLNMPRMNGLELLEVLRSDPYHAHTDVVVVTTSLAAEDRNAAWRNRIAGYIVKSSHGATFDAFAQEVEAYLLRSALTYGRLTGPLDALVLGTPSSTPALYASLTALSHVETCTTEDATLARLLERGFDCLVVDVDALTEPLDSFTREATRRGISLPATVIYAPHGEPPTGLLETNGWVVQGSLAGDGLQRATLEAFARRRRDAFLTEHGSGVQVRLVPPRAREGSRRD